MKRDPLIHNRQSLRLRGYDYSQEGAYFVTVCTRNRKRLFGNIAGKEMWLNDAGIMIQSVWEDLPERFTNIEIDEFITMPNHIHAIIVIIRPDAGTNLSCSCYHDRPKGTLPGTIGRILQVYKSITTDEYITGVKKCGWEPFKRKLWQTNYWDHIIRDEKDYNHIYEYIYNNPAQWGNDLLNT